MTTIILQMLHGVSAPTRAERAVLDCIRAFNETHKAILAEAPDPAAIPARMKALDSAHKAYELAMPNLDSRASIRSFISCVARGAQMNVFTTRRATQLLYMAQVALSAQPQPKRRRRAA